MKVHSFSYVHVVKVIMLGICAQLFFACSFFKSKAPGSSGPIVEEIKRRKSTIYSVLKNNLDTLEHLTRDGYVIQLKRHVWHYYQNKLEKDNTQPYAVEDSLFKMIDDYTSVNMQNYRKHLVAWQAVQQQYYMAHYNFFEELQKQEFDAMTYPEAEGALDSLYKQYELDDLHAKNRLMMFFTDSLMNNMIDELHKPVAKRYSGGRPGKHEAEKKRGDSRGTPHGKQPHGDKSRENTSHEKEAHQKETHEKKSRH